VPEISQDLDVVVYSHKAFPFPRASSWLRPLPSGDGTLPLADVWRDDTGDAIAPLHRALLNVDGSPSTRGGKYFSDITGLYWLWKNRTEVRRIGLYQYRRYLNLLPTMPQSPEIQMTPTDHALAFLASEEQKERINRLLDVYDVIVPQGLLLPYNIEEQYLLHHERKSWDRFWELTFALYPEYAAHRDFLRISNKFHFHNIFIAGVGFLDCYAKQLFRILDPLVREIGFPAPQPPGTRYQEYRYPGYLSERFFTYFLFANQVRVYEAQLVILHES
jgi:uncharacterized protein DUF4422